MGFQPPPPLVTWDEHLPHFLPSWAAPLMQPSGRNQRPPHHRLSSTFPQSSWAGWTSLVPHTSLGPNIWPASRSCHKGSQAEPARSCLALYKPYQTSSAGTSSSQPRDKPGKHVSPSRINIYRAWLTFNPISTQHAHGEALSTLCQTRALWLRSGGLAQFHDFPLIPQALYKCKLPAETEKRVNQVLQLFLFIVAQL